MPQDAAETLLSRARTWAGSSAGARVLLALAWSASVVGAFFLGALEAQQRWEEALATASRPVATLREKEARAPLPPGGWVVAARGGEAYHLPWCPGAQRLNPATARWFTSESEARKAGYRPARNCPGLEARDE